MTQSAKENVLCIKGAVSRDFLAFCHELPGPLRFKKLKNSKNLVTLRCIFPLKSVQTVHRVENLHMWISL